MVMVVQKQQYWAASEDKTAYSSVFRADASRNDCVLSVVAFTYPQSSGFVALENCWMLQYIKIIPLGIQEETF